MNLRPEHFAAFAGAPSSPEFEWRKKVVELPAAKGIKARRRGRFEALGGIGDNATQ